MSRDVQSAAREAQAPKLKDFYWDWFSAVQSHDEAVRKDAFRLRYQVYCVENPFEDPADNPDGLETDHYDSHAVHTNLIHKPTGLTAGTVRLVLPLADHPERSFAIHEVCTEELLKDPVAFPVARMGEISRFSVSKDFRRRRGDGLYPRFEEVDRDRITAQSKRVIPNMTLGLIEGLVRMTVDNGLTHWCAVMEPALLRLLTRMGIHFEHIGPLVDFHGRRQPCYARLDRLLQRVRREQPEIWEVLTRDGAHVEKLTALMKAQS